ncbi:MAG: hypothetical protein ACPL4K_05755 [Candidatus Margulisiibacteriota bacterium]
MNKNLKIALVISILVLVCLGGILIFRRFSSSQQPASKSSKEGNTVEKVDTISLTAKEAYEKLVVEAHKWQSDAQAYKLSDQSRTGDVKITQDGKSNTWSFWFASPSKKEIRVFTFRNKVPYSYPEGGGGRLSYDTPNWDNDWKIDSDKALEIAKTAGSGEITAARMYLYGSSFVTVPRQVRKSSQSITVWWEIYGKDKKVYIDASTGSVLGSEM